MKTVLKFFNFPFVLFNWILIRIVNLEGKIGVNVINILFFLILGITFSFLEYLIIFPEFDLKFSFNACKIDYFIYNTILIFSVSCLYYVFCKLFYGKIRFFESFIFIIKYFLIFIYVIIFFLPVLIFSLDIIFSFSLIKMLVYIYFIIIFFKLIYSAVKNPVLLIKNTNEIVLSKSIIIYILTSIIFVYGFIYNFKFFENFHIINKIAAYSFNRNNFHIYNDIYYAAVPELEHYIESVKPKLEDYLQNDKIKDAVLLLQQMEKEALKYPGSNKQILFLIYQYLAPFYYKIEDKESFKIAIDKYLELSSPPISSNVEPFVRGLKLKGIFFANNGNYQEALKFLNKAFSLSIANEVPKEEVSKIANQLRKVYEILKQHDDVMRVDLKFKEYLSKK